MQEKSNFLSKLLFSLFFSFLITNILLGQVSFQNKSFYGIQLLSSIEDVSKHFNDWEYDKKIGNVSLYKAKKENSIWNLQFYNTNNGKKLIYIMRKEGNCRKSDYDQLSKKYSDKLGLPNHISEPDRLPLFMARWDKKYYIGNKSVILHFSVNYNPEKKLLTESFNFDLFNSFK